MESTYLKGITNEFKSVYEKLKKEKLIKNESLNRPAGNNLHSWLQYALIMAGERNGLRAVPEIKLYFKEDLNPKKIAPEIKKTELRSFSRVDVAFYKNSELVGIGEVHTINDSNVFLSTRRFVEKGILNFLSDRDVLMHTIQHGKNKLKFVILVVTLPKRASRVPWRKDMEQVMPEIEFPRGRKSNKDFYKVFNEGWRKLRDAVEEENVACSLVIITEDMP